MIVDRTSQPGGRRVALALGICTALFLSDVLSPIEMNGAQLYPLALLPLYRVGNKSLLWGACALAIALIIAGFAVSPSPDSWNGITMRAFSVLMVAVTAVSFSRLSGYERKLLLESLTDPLTGLLNRRSFLYLSSREEARTQRYGRMLSVLMLDIDHFKRINDTYGHAVGDVALKALADTCTKCLRPTDLLARYGGEEFVIALPETNAADARMVAERLREAIAQLSVRVSDEVLALTVSIGVSTYLNGEPLDQAIERADQAMYRAKHNGRNRVEISAAAELATA